MTDRPNLDDLDRLAERATDGPWIVGEWTDYGEEPRRTLASLNGYEVERLNIATTADAEFIAAARTGLPALTAALRAVLAVDTGDNRALYGNDFEAGMAKALWLVKGAIDQRVGVDR